MLFVTIALEMAGMIDARDSVSAFIFRPTKSGLYVKLFMRMLYTFNVMLSANNCDWLGEIHISYPKSMPVTGRIQTTGRLKRAQSNRK
jgi:hypothetical protein